MKLECLASVLILAILLGVAPSGGAQKGPISLSVGVWGSLPVLDLRGNEGKARSTDPFVKQSLDSDCLVRRRPFADEVALAGVAGGQLTLKVDLAWCEDDLDNEPEVECSWRIESANACDRELAAPDPGTVQWKGRQGELSIDLPKTIGSYELTAECAGGGAKTAEPLKTPLLVTYGPPVWGAWPPRVSSYKRATEWACGATPEMSEPEVLERLLAGLYAYGRANWRYGSFQETGSQGWTPSDETGDPTAKPEDQWFGCPWEALTDDPPKGRPTCNYAHCYTYSQAFEHIAAALGIGVMEPIVDVGSNGTGFVTQAGAKSLDPEFAGNVVCHESADKCAAYLFSSHSLRARDGKFYDATFNGIYDSADEFIGGNLSGYSNGAYTVEETGERYKYLEPMRGHWSRYQGIEPAEAIPALHTVAQTNSSGAASLGPPKETHTQDGLLVQFRVRLKNPGTFGLQAHLAAEGGGGAAIPATAAGSPVMTNFVLEGPMDSKVAVTFDYRAIRAAWPPKEGEGSSKKRYEYVIELTRTDPSGDSAQARVQPVAVRTGKVKVSSQDMAARRAAYFTDSQPESVRWSPDRSHFLVVYRVTAPKTGRTNSGFYALLSRLARGGKSLSYHGSSYSMEKGTHRVQLSISVPETLAADSETVLELTAEIQQNLDKAWYEDTVDFLRATIRVKGDEVSLETADSPGTVTSGGP